jgi:uncharacterized Zn finger protein (UPF0148 family)
MRVRGRRECQACGREWSYYDTGSVACPACGSLRSVGVDERTRHTAAPVAFDLSEHRRALEGGSIADVVADVKRDCRAYVRQRGFIREGELLELDDSYLAAAELAQAVDIYDRVRAPADAERLYVLSLLRGADLGDRPEPDAVPSSMRSGRGLAYADAVREYRRETLTWLDDADRDAPTARRALGTADEIAKRIGALQGDVEPGLVESLVSAARDVATALRSSDGSDDEQALATAQDRLDRLVGEW